MMTGDFNALPWHDSILLEVSIDRRDPGNRDEVTMLVEWPDGARDSLTFYDCYQLEASMKTAF